MVGLNDLTLFAKIFEAGNFTEAAQRLGMPVSTISRRVAALEERFGVRLLQRSTRSLALTEAWAALLDHARQAAELNEAVDTFMSGLLRPSDPPSVSASLMAP